MSRLLALAATALAAACATTPIPGIYESIVPAGSDRGERHIRVTLKPDGAAAVSSAFSERPSRFLAEGTWENDGRRILVALNDQKKMAFQLAGDQLLAREWDSAIWGAAGPGVLNRVFRPW